jgi:hypothetical protein
VPGLINLFGIELPGLTAALARAARQLLDRRELTTDLSGLGNDSVGSQLVDRLRQHLRQLLRELRHRHAKLRGKLLQLLDSEALLYLCG